MEQEQEVKLNRRLRWGRILSGIVVVAIGKTLLLKQLGFDLPHWLCTWPMLIIALGLFIWFKHGYSSAKGLIVVLIGALFLIDRNVPGINISAFIWPVVIILAGLFIMFRPRKHRMREEYWKKRWIEHHQKMYTEYENKNNDDFINSTTVFGGAKKTIVSKLFKGGEIVNVFGGTELNLSKADIEGRVVLDVTQVLGGTEIIVPSHWEIRSEEMIAIFGGMEDKRIVKPENTVEATKTLVIRGTSVFGGISITSY